MAIWPGTLEDLVVNPGFWKDKRVLLTGHTGFKGSWLSLWMQSMNARVIGYALAPTTNPGLFEAANIGKGMISIIGDIRDLESLHKVFDEHKPEIVFHMAAQSLVRRSYSEPVATYSTNVMGTVNLLEAVRGSDSVKAVVNVTSDKCYENQERVWSYRESDAMGGYDPYSNSKGCSELVTAAYRNSYFNHEQYNQHGVALASARAGNVIGGGDWAEDRLIPDIMNAISQSEPVNIRNPYAIRPWQHVLEPLSGYLLLAQNLYTKGTDYAEAWNFGPDDDAKPVQWIVEKLTSNWGEGATWVRDDADHPHEAHYLQLDCSKARARMGWQPKWHLEEALDAIIDWYRGYLNGQDLRELTLRQINAYNDRLKKP